MEDRPLPPEATLDLRIHLDKVKNLQERCREALQKFVEGRVSRQDYFALVESQSAAQKAWERRNKDYFDEPQA
jgi:hypothetical protein